MNMNEKKRRRSLVTGVLLLLLACLTVLQVVLFNLRLAESLRCQSDFNNYVSAVLADRSQLADQDRANLDRLVRDSLLAQGDEDRNIARQNYLDRKARIDSERRGVPLPDVSEGVERCG